MSSDSNISRIHYLHMPLMPPPSKSAATEEDITERSELQARISKIDVAQYRERSTLPGGAYLLLLLILPIYLIVWGYRAYCQKQANAIMREFDKATDPQEKIENLYEALGRAKVMEGAYYLALAKEYLLQENTDKALEVLEREYYTLQNLQMSEGLNLQPENDNPLFTTEYWQLLGACHYQRKEYGHAAGAYQNAYRIQNKFPIRKLTHNEALDPLAIEAIWKMMQKRFSITDEEGMRFYLEKIFLVQNRRLVIQNQNHTLYLQNQYENSYMFKKYILPVIRQNLAENITQETRDKINNWYENYKSHYDLVFDLKI